jgi:hypothetical protein
VVLAAMVCGASPGLYAQAAHTSATYFAAPTGLPTNDGSRERPWNLQTALANRSGVVQPGDTIWLTAGRYVGDFRSALRGTAERPVVVRQLPTARATIDGRLDAYGAYTIFWDFEVTQSPGGPPRLRGIDVRGPGHRFVNLVIHDASSSGVGFWMEGSDAEVYGCLIYRNGSLSSLDHGIYAINRDGHKTIADNIVFDNFAYGIHVYGGAGQAIRHVTIDGNIVFGNGSISPRDRTKSNLLVGGDGIPADDIEITRNLFFYDETARTPNVRLGYDPKIENGDLTMDDNVIVGGEPPVATLRWRSVRAARNQIDGTANVAIDEAPPSSSMRAARLVLPRSERPVVAVRANRYEAGRANVAIIFPPAVLTARISLDSVLHPGERYVVRRAGDFFGPPVAAGVYRGGAVQITRTAPSSPADAVPNRRPSLSSIEAFVVQRVR